MYPNNIYIKHHEELKSYGVDMGVAFDMFDNKYGLKHDDRERAEYKHWRSVVTGVPELLSRQDKEILGLI